jgi:hypothetical protein
MSSLVEIAMILTALYMYCCPPETLLTHSFSLCAVVFLFFSGVLDIVLLPYRLFPPIRSKQASLQNRIIALEATRHVRFEHQNIDGKVTGVELNTMADAA